MDYSELWQSVLAQMQLQISKASFATWFMNTGIVGKEEERVIVAVPNSFSKEWLSNKYYKTILNILHEADGTIKEMNFIIQSQNAKPMVKKIDTQTSQLPVEQLKFEEFKVNKDTNLNPKYNFDNFIVGSFNELAYAACQAVIENPGYIYNPLFIYGGVGLGKTHLIQSTGNKIADSLQKKRVKYLSSEKLVSGIVSAVRSGTVETLRASFLPLDVLIIDDIQFISGKDKTQEEFFHIFNSLYERNKQIIFSSDRPPNAIPEVEERLRSRFGGGMIADISMPDYETRLLILKAKLQEKKSSLPDDVIDYIASNVKKNIRELEGAVNSLLAACRANGATPNMETTKRLLKGFVFSPFNVTNYKKIIETVAKFYNLDEKHLFHETRRKEIVKPRQIAMFLLRKELKYSFPAIARKFGGKDHTTVIYAFKKISEEIEKNNKTAEELNLIKQRVYSG